MTDKAKRNDPCPCGSGKKYKQCCMRAALAPPKPLSLKNRKITVQGAERQKEDQEQTKPKQINLLERAFGVALIGGKEEELLVKERYPDVGAPEGLVSGIEPDDQ